MGSSSFSGSLGCSCLNMVWMTNKDEFLACSTQHGLSMDGLIYYIIPITIDDPCWVEHAKKSSLLVIHTIFIQLHPNEPLKLDDPLSLRKLTGEVQIVK